MKAFATSLALYLEMQPLGLYFILNIHLIPTIFPAASLGTIT